MGTRVESGVVMAAVSSRVKYAIIIPDGGADRPLPGLAGRTPLQAARTPNLDRLAQVGRVGVAHTTPPGFGAGSDVCSMCLLGYSPERYHTGRAPLEAASLGVRAGATDWLFRLNFVTVSDDEPASLMLDHSAGGLSTAEGHELARALTQAWQELTPDLAGGFQLVPGEGYRCILVDRRGADHTALRTTPPHEIPNEPWADALPNGPSADALRQLMAVSRGVLAAHPINAARRAAGKRPAAMAWIWGQGLCPEMPSFESRFGLRGAITTAVDLLSGIARLIGWDVLDVPGVTGYHDNDYAAQGQACAAALDDYDLVCAHVESPDEASHQGDAATKVAALEAIDRDVVAPILERLVRFGDPEREPGAIGWRLLVMPDHYTLVSTRKHDATPVPVLMAGSWVRSVVPRAFDEPSADASDLRINPGHDLMEYFLFAGLRPGERGGRGD